MYSKGRKRYFICLINSIIKINFNLFEEWKGEFCETIITEIIPGEKIAECECKKLSPTTVIADVENIFQNSQISEVFSDEGLS